MPVVNPNPNAFRIMDYGAAVKAGSDIKTSRLKNEALGMDIQEAKNTIARREQANEIRATFERMPEQIRELEAAGLYDEANEQRDVYLTTMKAEVDILQAFREGIDEENYLEVKQQFQEEGNLPPGLWPNEYSDDWFRDQVNNAKGNLSRLTRKWGDEGVTFNQDFIQQNGEIVWEGEPYQDKDGAGSGEFKGVTNAVSGEIRQQINRQFEGIRDPVSGEFRITDTASIPRAAQWQEDAERIYKAGEGNITIGEAVARAGRRIDAAIGDTSEKENISNILGLPTPPRIANPPQPE